MNRITSIMPHRSGDAWVELPETLAQTPMDVVSVAPVHARRLPTGPELWAHLTSPAAKGAAISMAGGISVGVSTPLIAMVSSNCGPLSAASMMQAGAAIFCGATAWVIPQPGVSVLPIDGRALAHLLGVGLTGSVIGPGTTALAMRHTSAASVALTMNIEPFIAAAIAWPLYHERPSKHTVGAGALAIGSTVLCSVGQLQQSSTSGAGIGIAFGSAVVWALSDLIFYGLRDRKPQHVVGTCAAMGAIASAAIAGFMHEEFPSATDAGKLLGCGALAFGVSNSLFALALPQAGVGRTTLLFATMGLASGTALSCAMGQGTFTPFIGASLALALIGALVLGAEKFQSPSARTATPMDEEAQATVTDSEEDTEPSAFELQEGLRPRLRRANSV